MTNREWLSSLSDEALAYVLKKEPFCVCCAYYGEHCWGTSCGDGFLAWLKKEHKDGEASKVD
jgi:hypothetical protein